APPGLRLGDPGGIPAALLRRYRRFGRHEEYRAIYSPAPPGRAERGQADRRSRADHALRCKTIAAASARVPTTWSAEDSGPSRLTRIVRQPALRPASTSLSESPIITLRGRSRLRSAAARSNNPGAGLRHPQ